MTIPEPVWELKVLPPFSESPTGTSIVDLSTNWCKVWGTSEKRWGFYMYAVTNNAPPVEYIFDCG